MLLSSSLTSDCALAFGEDEFPKTPPLCRNAFSPSVLGLDFQCRDDVSELRYNFWDCTEQHGIPGQRCVNWLLPSGG